MNKKYLAPKTEEYVLTFWNHIRECDYDVKQDALVTGIEFIGHGKSTDEDIVGLLIHRYAMPSLLIPFGEWKPADDTDEYRTYAASMYQAYVIIALTTVAPMFFEILPWETFFQILSEQY